MVGRWYSVCRLGLVAIFGVVFLVGCQHANIQKEAISGFIIETPLDDKNQPNGISKGYDETTKKLVFERSYKEGRKDGVWREYYPNGVLKYEGYYKNNLPDGKWTFFYESGKIQSQQFYKDNKMSGVWKTFDEKGNVTNEEAHP